MYLSLTTLTMFFMCYLSLVFVSCFLMCIRCFVAVSSFLLGTNMFWPIYEINHILQKFKSGSSCLVQPMFYPFLKLRKLMCFDFVERRNVCYTEDNIFDFVPPVSQGSLSCRWKRWIVMTATLPMLSCGSASWNRHPGFPPAKCSSSTPSPERFPSLRKVSPN